MGKFGLPSGKGDENCEHRNTTVSFFGNVVCVDCHKLLEVSKTVTDEEVTLKVVALKSQELLEGLS